MQICTPETDHLFEEFNSAYTGYFSCFCCPLPTFFKNYFFQNILSGTLVQCTIRVSNGLDTDQDQLSVGPDLGPNTFVKVISSPGVMVVRPWLLASNQGLHCLL